MEGLVTNIQRFSLHDGPGIRTTVFLKGCPLDCPWCHNPESKLPYKQIILHKDHCHLCKACLDACKKDCLSINNGEIVYNGDNCDNCLVCSEVCNFGGIEVVGKYMTVQQVIDEVTKDNEFYKQSGGGLTLSGGEPLIQAEFTKNLLSLAKQKGIHTCVETCGFCNEKTLLDTLKHADIVLYDIKDTNSERHLSNTGVELIRIKSNLHALDELKIKTHMRCILVNGINMEEDHYIELAKLYDELEYCFKLELLPYHNFGKSKFIRIGKNQIDDRNWTSEYSVIENARNTIIKHMKTEKRVLISD